MTAENATEESVNVTAENATEVNGSVNVNVNVNAIEKETDSKQREQR